MTEKLREACGVFGVYAPGEDVARITFFGLFSLQHRGQESAGIATADGKRIHLYTSMGLVSQVFNESALGPLTGHIAIGHTRYSTTGSSKSFNAQPIMARGPALELALGHNGNIINTLELRKELQEQGYQFSSSTDSEVIAYLIVAAPGKTLEEKIKYSMRRLQGAYTLVILTGDTLIGVRDPFGVRPLCLGRLNGGWVLASESCALDHIGAEFMREITPGEMVFINGEGLRSMMGAVEERTALCIFEHIYFARPDSVFGGRLLYPARESMGARLAMEYPVEADLVMGIPDSATPAAIGYSRESGIPLSYGLIKNRYIGRTFIEPDQRIRDLGVKLKFNPMPKILSEKRVVVVDDSIVRGTTTPHVISLLRRAGAREVHMRVCAPPIRYPCFFGVDFAKRRELIAAQKTVEEIRKFIGADSLGYLSIEGLMEAVGLPREAVCLACFTGSYPIPVQLEMDKLAMEVAEEEIAKR